MLALAFVGGPAKAQQAAGAVLAVSGTASAESARGETRSLGVGDPVFEGDTIRTGAGSILQIVLIDETKIALGPDAELVLDAFTLGEGNTFSELSMDALGGSFRFITGNSASDAVTVTTPTATIGFRGTGIDLYVIPGPDGEAGWSLFDGSVLGCTQTCELIEESCDFVTVDRTFEIDFVELLGDRLSLALDFFPFLINERLLDVRFHLGTAGCALDGMLGSAPESTGAQPIGYAFGPDARTDLLNNLLDIDLPPDTGSGPGKGSTSPGPGTNTGNNGNGDNGEGGESGAEGE